MALGGVVTREESPSGTKVALVMLLIDLVTQMSSICENSFTSALTNLCTFSLCYLIKSIKKWESFLYSQTSILIYIHTYTNKYACTHTHLTGTEKLIHKMVSWGRSRYLQVHVLIKEDKVIVMSDRGVLDKASRPTWKWRFLWQLNNHVS